MAYGEPPVNDNLPIDRYALGFMVPSETSSITRWVLDQQDLSLGPSSDWSEDEQDRLRPGIELLGRVSYMRVQVMHADSTTAAR
jgi:hypothetical protein